MGNYGYGHKKKLIMRTSKGRDKMILSYFYIFEYFDKFEKLRTTSNDDKTIQTLIKDWRTVYGSNIIP